MSPIATLVNELRRQNPALKFDVVEKNETVYVDDDAMPDQFIAVVANDVAVINPFESECGRFDVDPMQEYGIPLVVAVRMQKYNQSSVLSA